MKKLNNIFRKSWGYTLAILTLLSTSCNKYLDIAPDDGMATLEMVFNMRSTAIKYLYSCEYHYRNKNKKKYWYNYFLFFLFFIAIIMFTFH